MSDFSPLFQKQIQEHVLIGSKKFQPIGPQLFHAADTEARFYDMQTWQGPGTFQSRIPLAPISLDTVAPSFNKRYIMVPYSLGTVVAEEDIADDMYGMITKWTAATGGLWAVSRATTMEYLAASFFGNGFTATAGMPDGVALFSASHPVSRNNPNATYSSLVSGNPDLSMGSLLTARQQIVQQKAANNLTFLENNIKRLVVNPNSHQVAMQILRGEWERGTADRNMNVLRKEDIQLVEWPYWTAHGTTGTLNSWFIQGDQHSLYWVTRENMRFASEKLAGFNAIAFYLHMRLAFGATDSRGIVGSQGA